jgi:hypothetical protein
MNKRTYTCRLLLCLMLGVNELAAQTITTATTPIKPAIDHSYKPLTLKLNEDGSKYVRFIMWHQMWLTATQNNPGTIDVNGQTIDGSNGSRGWTTDVALRRSRFLAYAQISPRALILSHWGINNQSFINGGAGAGSNVSSAGPSNNGKRPQLYMHDLWTEFQVLKDKLYIGAGLHYWNGVSRLSSHSTLNFMTMDAPIFNWSNIEGTDQFARQYGIYAKGQLGRFDYRFALNKPFVNGRLAKDVPKNNVAENVINENWAQAGYVNYMFWEKENNKLPFYVGSYLGTKKVLNLGAGFYRHNNASLKKNTEGDSLYQAHLAVGADLFLELPINKTKGTMLHALATFYHLNYGDNYLRNIGILNEHGGTIGVSAGQTRESWSGGGNLQPTIGSGNIFYLQTGFLLPKLKNGTAFMPYVTTTYKDFDRLAESSFQYGLGMNYFVTGHHAKLTLEYANRPIYREASDGAIRLNGTRGQLTLQMHIFI